MNVNPPELPLLPTPPRTEPDFDEQDNSPDEEADDQPIPPVAPVIQAEMAAELAVKFFKAAQAKLAAYAILSVSREAKIACGLAPDTKCSQVTTYVN